MRRARGSHQDTAARLSSALKYQQRSSTTGLR